MTAKPRNLKPSRELPAYGQYHIVDPRYWEGLERTVLFGGWMAPGPGPGLNYDVVGPLEGALAA